MDSKEITTSYFLYQYPSRFILGKESNSYIYMNENTKYIGLNEEEKRIIKELMKNSRRMNSEISRDAKIDYKKTVRIISSLEKKEILKGYRAFIDLDKIRYSYYKVLLFLDNYDLKIINEIRNSLKRDPRVNYLVGHLGKEEIDFEAVYKNEKDFFNHLDCLNDKFPEIIKGNEYSIFEKVIKVNYLPIDF